MSDLCCRGIDWRQDQWQWHTRQKLRLIVADENTMSILRDTFLRTYGPKDEECKNGNDVLVSFPDNYRAPGANDIA